MGHTNSTPNLHLPQFVGSDKPTWLSDVNGAMLAIDTAYGTIEADASSAATAAAGAVTVAGAAQDAADAAASAAATAGTNASQALTTANNATTVALQAKTDADKALDLYEGVVLASVTADGVKSYATLLAELAATVDLTKITNKSVLTVGTNVFHLRSKTSDTVSYACLSVSEGAGGSIFQMKIGATNNRLNLSFGTTPAIAVYDESSNAPANGFALTIYA